MAIVTVINAPFGAIEAQTPTYAATIDSTISNQKTAISSTLTGNLAHDLTINSELKAGAEITVYWTASGAERTVNPGTGFNAATPNIVIPSGVIAKATYRYNGTDFQELAEPTAISDPGVVLNTTHRGSSGTDHANVVVNDTHTAGDGSDHSDVAAITAGTQVITGDSLTSSGVGAKNGATVTVVEAGNGAVHKTTLTLTNTTVALTDNAGVVAYMGVKVYDMPEGAILMLGSVLNLVITKDATGVNADWDGDIGLGTITAASTTPLATTEQNIIPTTATPQAAAATTTAVAQSTATENAVVDGTGTAMDVFLNVLVDDADHDVTSTATNFIFNGTITLFWTNLGDY